LKGECVYKRTCVEAKRSALRRLNGKAPGKITAPSQYCKQNIIYFKNILFKKRGIGSLVSNQCCYVSYLFSKRVILPLYCNIIRRLGGFAFCVLHIRLFPAAGISSIDHVLSEGNRALGGDIGYTALVAELSCVIAARLYGQKILPQGGVANITLCPFVFA
jgi:hypothetical protein